MFLLGKNSKKSSEVDFLLFCCSVALLFCCSGAAGGKRLPGAEGRAQHAQPHLGFLLFFERFLRDFFLRDFSLPAQCISANFPSLLLVLGEEILLGQHSIALVADLVGVRQGSHLSHV